LVLKIDEIPTTIATADKLTCQPPSSFLKSYVQWVQNLTR